MWIGFDSQAQAGHRPRVLSGFVLLHSALQRDLITRTCELN
jgi:hypothetical protein